MTNNKVKTPCATIRLNKAGLEQNRSQTHFYLKALVTKVCQFYRSFTYTMRLYVNTDYVLKLCCRIQEKRRGF